MSSSGSTSQSTYQPQSLNSYLHTKTTPHAGIGVFATHVHSPGTPILTATPVLILPSPITATGLETAFQALPLEQQFAFDLLHEANIPYPTERLRIYMSNSFTYADNPNIHCILLPTSRINHSCVPNVRVTWNPVTKEHDVFTLALLKEGEEITITYAGALEFLRTRERRMYLKHHYDFDCTCKACTPGTDFHNTSEMRRMLALAIQHTLNGTARSADLHFDSSSELERIGIRNLPPRKTLRLGEEAWWAFVLAKLLEAEGLVGMPLIAPYSHAAMCLAECVTNFTKARQMQTMDEESVLQAKGWIGEWGKAIGDNVRLCFAEGHPMRKFVRPSSE